MSALHSLSSAVFVISMLMPCLDAIRVRSRRSGLAGYDDPYALTDALQAIDRERRRSSLNSRLEESILGDDDSYFNPNSISDLDEDYIRSLQYLDDEDQARPQYYPGYAFDDDFEDLAPLSAYPRQYGDVGGRLYGPKKRTAYSPHRVSPSFDQLRDLFGEANIPRKRMATQRLPKLIEAEQHIRNAEEDTRDLAHKMISEAQKISETEVSEQTDGNKPTIVKDVKIEKTNPDGTTQTLEELFDGADTGDSDDQLSNDDGAESTEGENEESEVINNEADDSVSQTKTKRASSEPCTQESVYIGELLTEIARLRGQLSKLETEQVLEDKENDLLADALVYSTLDQLSGGSEYVDKEYSDISKATDTEELIQMLADDEEEGGDEGYDDTEGRIEEYLEPSVVNEADDDFVKRSDDTENEIQWYDRPVKASVSGAHLAVEDDSDDDRPVEFIGGETPIDVPYPDDEDEAAEEAAEQEQAEEEEEEKEVEREALENAVAEVEKAVALENEEANKVEMLRSLLQGLSPDEMGELIEELKTGEAMEKIQEEGVCPAALELSDNCAFADVLGIPIDTDARNLCMRHQLCYTCGTEMDITQDGCDQGYKETAVNQCGGDRDCVRSAVLFLTFMQEYHGYASFGPRTCTEPCIETFVIQGK